MDRTWNFIQLVTSKSEQNILMQAMKACNVNVTSYVEALDECSKIYGGLSYHDMLTNLFCSFDINLTEVETRSEKLLIGYIGYFLLEHDESFRLKLSAKELMPRDKDKFKVQYFLKLKTSSVFWFKIAMYIFWYYHMDVEAVSDKTDKNTSCSDIIRQSFIASTLPFLEAGWVSRSLGGIFRGGMFSSYSRVSRGIAATVAALISENDNSIDKSFVESFVEKLPIHIAIIYLHLAQTYEISTFDEVKVILRTAIMNATLNANKKYVWDDVRRGLLRLAIRKLTVYNQDVVNGILSHEVLEPAFPLNVYLPQHIIYQILSFGPKEIIDYIYGFNVNNDKASDYKLLESYDYYGKVLLEDYCFPFTNVNDQRYCLLKDDVLEAKLAQLYYEINNLDSKKLCVQTISGHYDFIQTRLIDRTKGEIEDRTWLRYKGFADNVVYIQSGLIRKENLRGEDTVELNCLRNEIMELKKRLCDLENLRLERDNFKKRLQDQEQRCRRVKHDLEGLLSSIIRPVKRYVNHKDDPKVKEETFEKFKSSIHSYDILCKSWRILTQEEMHGELKKVPMAEICKMFNDFTHKLDDVKFEIQNQIPPEKDVSVYVSEYFELQVINNIFNNLNDHAFVGINSNRKLYSRISNDEGYVTISIENNGHPIKFDNPEDLFQYSLPNRKGVGLSNIRDCMRYANGDFRIESNINSEYSTIYVLTFKIV